MREIKFRAWGRTPYSDSPSMTKPFDFRQYAMYHEAAQERLLPTVGDDVVYMQYTCLKDKKGVEIYEGDIVEGGFERHRGVVSFGLYANPFGSDEWTGYQGFYIKWSKDHADMTRGDIGYWTSKGMETAIEVIGNIYENPELLEKS